MKTTRFFANGNDANAIIAIVRALGLDPTNYVFVSADDIGHGEYEITVTGTVANIRKLRRALSNGDAS